MIEDDPGEIKIMIKFKTKTMRENSDSSKDKERDEQPAAWVGGSSEIYLKNKIKNLCKELSTEHWRL